MNTQRLHVIDSHTGGEPTRTVVSGFPELNGNTMTEKLATFRQQYDHLRTALLKEPRGNEVMVGALLCEPADVTCTAGVIFFNNTGYLGMCGHGLIGVIETLRWHQQLPPGSCRIETPVGVVTATLHEDGHVSIQNVPAHRKASGVTVELPGIGTFTGDVAYGGNWFYLVENHSLKLSCANVPQLTDVCLRLREAVRNAGHPEVDHIELFSAPDGSAHHSRNFVLCPGGEYDRSPCGTGTSAKLACLAADGKLAPGQIWRQESIIDSVFEGSYEPTEQGIIPTITGQAFVTADSQLILNPNDPFQFGIP
jgi:4-hydroxyproline epimerase